MFLRFEVFVVRASRVELSILFQLAPFQFSRALNCSLTPRPRQQFFGHRLCCLDLSLDQGILWEFYGINFGVTRISLYTGAKTENNEMEYFFFNTIYYIIFTIYCSPIFTFYLSSHEAIPLHDQVSRGHKRSTVI